MRIDLEVTQDVAASRERVWEKLLDSKFVGACAPGVESVEPTGDNRFRVVVGAGFGPIRIRFKLDFALSELAPPASARVAVVGKAPGSEVRADGVATLKVSEELGGGHTLLTFAAGIDVSGMIVSVGGKSLPATARSITGQFWRTFAERIAAAPS
jgi:carbon monoxide dehydrogenase subunit G